MTNDPVTTRLLRQALPVVTTLASLLLVVTLAGALYLGRVIGHPALSPLRDCYESLGILSGDAGR